MSRDLTVACVMRSGGLYNGRWVRRLRNNVARYAPPHRFVCLSDVQIEGIETIPLKHDWPRWWPILEVFRPGLFAGRVVYLDLADLIVWNMEVFFKGRGFFIAPNPYRRLSNDCHFASGCMAFDAGDTFIYDSFVPEASRHIARLHGDQEWIAELLPMSQTFDPRWCVSYKGNCSGRRGIPKGARIVFVHGQPKPHEITDRWFRDRWDGDWEAAA